jgi:pyridoxal phosphate-dependent aminotransferase EpsN
LLLEAFDSGWIAPVGPHLDAFEQEVAACAAVPHAAALSSGTAALHLGLRLLGVGPGDDVIAPTLTFAATVNAIAYVGATPVLVDVSPDTWTMDPDLLEEELRARQRTGRMPAAVISVDLYGQCCDYARLSQTCTEFGVPLLEDAAEALGASCEGGRAGGFGECAVFSFNGNKVITTGGGGMLLSRNRELVERARHLATQARDPAPHYEHSEIGYNYRMSNLLAAIGRGQLKGLAGKIERRRGIRRAYQEALAGCPGIDFLPEAPYGRSNAWLTCITVEPALFGATREDVRLRLEAANIESRPIWKPMHLQPVFRNCRTRGGDVASSLFKKGLCLPSGSNLSPVDQARVIVSIEETALTGAGDCAANWSTHG